MSTRFEPANPFFEISYKFIDRDPAEVEAGLGIEPEEESKLSILKINLKL